MMGWNRRKYGPRAWTRHDAPGRGRRARRHDKGPRQELNRARSSPASPRRSRTRTRRQAQTLKEFIASPGQCHLQVFTTRRASAARRATTCCCSAAGLGKTPCPDRAREWRWASAPPRRCMNKTANSPPSWTTSSRASPVHREIHRMPPRGGDPLCAMEDHVRDLIIARGPRRANPTTAPFPWRGTTRAAGWPAAAATASASRFARVLFAGRLKISARSRPEDGLTRRIGPRDRARARGTPRGPAGCSDRVREFASAEGAR